MSDLLDADEHGIPPAIYTYRLPEPLCCTTCERPMERGALARRIGRSDSAYLQNIICTTCWEGMTQ